MMILTELRKTLKTLALILVLSCLCSLMAINANATVLKPLTLIQLTTQADLVFRGKVLAIDSHWDDTRSKIWTHVTFLVEEVVKGTHAQKEITLKLPGGAIEAEDIRMRVDGVPEFTVGEEVLLFCSKDPKRRNPIIGWYQGRFKIRFHEGLTLKVIEGERAARLMPAKRALPKGVKVSETVTYKEFVEEVRQIMNQAISGPKP